MKLKDFLDVFADDTPFTLVVIENGLIFRAKTRAKEVVEGNSRYLEKEVATLYKASGEIFIELVRD